MGFNLYLAGGDAVPLELNKNDNVGILTTFADGPKTVKKFIDKRHCKTFCDSGAYGAAHSGKVIDLDQYIEFINDTPECDVFAVLDVIPWSDAGYMDGGAKQLSADDTWKNYVYMLERVKPEYRDKLVCAYHYGEPETALQRIISGIDGYKPSYIAFGGRAGTHTKDLYNFFDDKFWKWIERSENPKIKIHAFGVTVFEMLERYPWYSADSTTWLRTGIAGNIHSRHCVGSVVNISTRKAENGKKSRSGALNNIQHLTPELREKIIEEIESRGFTLEQLAEDYKARNLWNCMYYKDWADNFTYKPKAEVKVRKGSLSGLY
jgi:hypothetical protein